MKPLVAIVSLCALAGWKSPSFAAAANELVAVRERFDRRIAEIRATGNLSLPAGSAVRWVSSAAGDDRLDGRSPNTAWRTLERLNAETLAAGSYVLFARGGTYRGGFKARPGVTYGSYGEGPKPRIFASPEDGADATKWRQTDAPNVWAYAIGSADVGTLVFDGGANHAVKVILRRDAKTGETFDKRTGRPFSSFRDLADDLTFWHDYKGTGDVYLFSRENPGLRFGAIEFCVKRACLDISGDGVTVDGLSIGFTGAHGVSAGTCRNLTVRNCEFAWIGGSIQAEDLFGRDYPTRYGNGVEIYGGCENYVVSNCFFCQIYDAGVTHQYDIAPSQGLARFDQRHVRYVDNVFSNCNYSIEYFLTAPGENPSLMEDIRFERNLMSHAGCGLCEQRPDKNDGAHIKGRYHEERNRARDFVIRDNVFYFSRDMHIDACAGLTADGESSLPVLENNLFIGREGDTLGKIAMESMSARLCDASSPAFLNTFGSGNRCLFLPEVKPVVPQPGEWHVYAETRDGVSGPQQVVNAITAAAAGDVIVVHPGTYDFAGVSMGSGKGGVVDHLIVGKSLEIRGVTFDYWHDDVVFTGPGRAINLTADVAFKVSGITFQNFNGGTDKGGAVVFNSGWVAGNAAHGDGTCLSNCVVRGCRAKIAGGVVNGFAVDCLFESNTASGYTGAAQGTRVVGCTFRDNSTSGNGCYYGALENPRGAYDCLFEGNKTYYYSAALSVNNNAAGVVVSNCTFRSNVTGSNIGTVGIENATTYAPTFIDCTFEANAAQEGSAIGTRRSNAVVSLVGCRFVCNTNNSGYAVWGATLFACPQNDAREFVFKSRFQATDCVFERNYATWVGGVASAGAFTNCTFVANLADAQNRLAGGSFYVGDHDVLDLKGCVFRDHSYNYYNWGGAIGVASNGTCHVDDCLFATNRHTYGAAIYVANNGTCQVENSVFRTNVCSSVGGAVYVEGNATTLFTNCWFEANACGQGAAVNGGVYEDCTFTNSAAKYGVAYGAEVRSSRFAGNFLASGGTCCDAESCRLVRCDLDGGAICLCSLDACRIHHVSIGKSKVHSAFFNANWATNCLIDHCYGDWGIIYSSRGSRAADTDSTVPEWVNCTFADNCFWQWYGFYCHDGGMTQLSLFENCVFSNNRNQNNSEHAWSDKGRVCDFNLYQNMDPAGTTLRNCLWGRMFADSYCVTNFTDGGGNVANADPLFARGAKGLDEYAIPRRSPARNAGVTRAWHAAARDFAGNDRVFEERVDIGCYECNIPWRGSVMIFR